MADETSVRQRKGKETEKTAPAAGGVDEVQDAAKTAERPKPKPKGKKPADKADDEDAHGAWLDVFRFIAFLFLVSCGLSYLISSGETFLWGMKNPPRYLQLAWWQRQWNGPIYLTVPELAVYDGSDPAKPIYLAINGTIFDVSANPRIYGPGGSYNVFAGADAARGFVTGCFKEDRTADMRGVEDMFLPLDDAAVDEHWPAAELARMREEELAEALRRVDESLAHWVNFFGNSKKYHMVGYVKREEGWLEKEPRGPLCAQAQQRRKPRAIPGQE